MKRFVSLMLVLLLAFTGGFVFADNTDEVTEAANSTGEEATEEFEHSESGSTEVEITEEISLTAQEAGESNPQVDGEEENLSQVDGEQKNVQLAAIEEENSSPINGVDETTPEDGENPDAEELEGVEEGSEEESSPKEKESPGENTEIESVEEALEIPEEALMLDSINGGMKLYPTANLVIDGELVESDVPSILYNLDGYTRTLVPLRLLSEKFGADVKWEQDEKRVKIFYMGNVISLKIEESVAIVNGVEKELPNGVPAKLMNYLDITRTLVPLRFISETYGKNVRWDGSTRSVFINSNKQSIVSESEPPEQTLVSVSVDYLEESKKVNLEFEGDFQGEWKEFFLPSCEGFEFDRMVFDFDNVILKNEDDALYDKDSKQLKINLESEDLKCVRLGQLAESPEYVTRVVVDMVGKREYTMEQEGNVISIQFSEKIDLTELEVESTDPEDLENVPEEDGYYEIGKEDENKKAPEDYLSYAVVKPKEFALMSINPDKKLTLVVKKDEDGFVNISIPEEYYQPNEFSSVVDDEFVKFIFVWKEDGFYNIRIKPQDGTEVYENPHTVDSIEHELVFARGSELRPISEGQRLVVIDPGHGGDDVGAKTNIDHTTELSIIENIAPLLKLDLEELGYAVLFTRDEDRYMSLFNRCKYAELAGADVLISVHANAFSEERAHGIEVFKRTSRNESRILASEILKFMVKLTGAVDRGVKDYDLYITERAFMPSTLVELGFITNKGELNNLKDPEYLERLSLAISAGVHSYFDKVK